MGGNTGRPTTYLIPPMNTCSQSRNRANGVPHKMHRRAGLQHCSLCGRCAQQPSARLPATHRPRFRNCGCLPMLRPLKLIP